MPNINTLIKDIQSLVGNKQGWFTEEVAKTYAEEVTVRLRRSFGARTDVPRLRLSQLGPKCPRALWHSIHSQGLAEPLPASAVVKFTYGHLIEALVIAWAKQAGHEVTGEQDELSLLDITGHRDCVIDGCVVDVKSTASRSFIKFKDHTLGDSDSFGYLDQLDGYLAASANDPLVRTKDVGYLFAVDKQLGHMVLYEHKLRPDHILQRINDYKRIVGLDQPPTCTCGTIADGKAGNVRLDVPASYSAFKHVCFPGLRTFLYSDGPRYLTKVVRKPDVIEVNRHGQVVYN